jgi:hypothetical protein
MRKAFRKAIRSSICTAALLAAVLLPVRAADETAASARVEPATTKVLLLPPVATASSFVLPELQLCSMRVRQQREFISRGFIVVSEALAAKAAAVRPALKIANADDRTAEVLDELAGRVGADWVVSIAARHLDFDDLPGGSTPWFVHCTVTVQIRDTRRRVWLANRPYTGRLFSVGPPPELLPEGLDMTTGQALASVLWPYTVVVPVFVSGNITDYLRGASGPIVVQPNKIFKGLKPPEVVK